MAKRISDNLLNVLIKKTSIDKSPFVSNVHNVTILSECGTDKEDILKKAHYWCEVIRVEENVTWHS